VNVRIAITRPMMILVVSAVLTGIGSPVAAAAALGCDNPTQSALDQYCATFPSAGGPRQALGNRTVLLPSLPARIRAQIQASPRARVLAGIPTATSTPSPATRRPVPEARAQRRPGVPVRRAEILPGWALVLLIALALAGAGIGIDRHRRGS
jgi:hypothetical protein